MIARAQSHSTAGNESIKSPTVVGVVLVTGPTTRVARATENMMIPGIREQGMIPGEPGRSPIFDQYRCLQWVGPIVVLCVKLDSRSDLAQVTLARATSAQLPYMGYDRQQ